MRFEDIAHLPCVFESLSKNRHPLLLGRDLAAVRMAGLATKDALTPAWKRVAAGLETLYANSHEVEWRFVHPPTKILSDPEKVLALDSVQTKALAKIFGVDATGSMHEVMNRILRAHEERQKILATDFPLPRFHRLVWKHYAQKRVTQTTALRELKVPSEVLARVPRKEAPNPHYRSAAPMKLFRYLDIVRALQRPFAADPRARVRLGDESVECQVPDGASKRPLKTRAALDATLKQLAEKRRKAKEASELASRTLAEERAEEEKIREAELERECERLRKGLDARFGNRFGTYVPKRACPLCSKTTRSGTRQGVLTHLLEVHGRALHDALQCLVT